MIGPLKRDIMMLFYLADLKAFRISKAMMSRIRLVNRVPLIVVLARLRTRPIASIVDWTFLKPN